MEEKKQNTLSETIEEKQENVNKEEKEKPQVIYRSYTLGRRLGLR